MDEKRNPVFKVDWEKLRQNLSNELITEKEERYQFTWPDKRKAILAANAPINATLRPCREESVDFDNTQNLYIEGDNLDVLKCLKETYLHKIKMIYIDPPYNTGNDFIYEDDFAESREEYLASSGQFDDQGNRLKANLESNGRFHTDWLNMIYPRLKVARDLLTDDGVIIVSIDFNEFGNLKKILDEVFGEANFQREIIWRIGWLSGYKTAAPNFIRNHDTMLIYSKDSNVTAFTKKYIENADFKDILKKDANLTKKFESMGVSDAQQKDLLDFINHQNRPDRYPIEDTWNCNEYDDLNSIAIVSFSGEKISKILGINQDFKGQKSIKMLMRLLEAYTVKHDIVMDFFSGTWSTAHAVMQLNSVDEGNRRYIMVQVPESTNSDSEAYKAGYKNICEIGKERIRRAGKKIKEESPLTTQNLDTGFRVLKLDSTNMEDVYYTPSEIQQSGVLNLIDNVKSDRTGEDLLFQVMLELGATLDSKIEVINVAGKTVYNVAENYLVACFDEEVNDAVVTEMAKMKPQYAVLRDTSMKDDSTATNFDQIFRTYSPDTTAKIL